MSGKSNTQHAFLGVGWSFPLGFEKDQSVMLSRYEEDVHQAIRIILGTRRGERVLRAEFGAGLEDFVFATINTTTVEQIRTRVRESLIDWEARIDVEEVSVKPVPADGRLDITVRYRIRSTNSLHNLVYPFYLEEGASS